MAPFWLDGSFHAYPMILRNVLTSCIGLYADKYISSRSAKFTVIFGCFWDTSFTIHVGFVGFLVLCSFTYYCFYMFSSHCISVGIPQQLLSSASTLYTWLFWNCIMSTNDHWVWFIQAWNFPPGPQFLSASLIATTFFWLQVNGCTSCWNSYSILLNIYKLACLTPYI